MEKTVQKGSKEGNDNRRGRCCKKIEKRETVMNDRGGGNLKLIKNKRAGRKGKIWS